MFDSNIFSIDQLDVIYLLPILESWLKRYLKFNKLDFFTTDNEAVFLDYLDKVLITKRNIKRIKEAIENNKGFWDRPSNKVFIPIKISDTSYDIITLYGIDKSIGPEESSRLLPVLQESIFLYLSRYKSNQILGQNHEIPAYLDTILNNHKSKTNDYILVIEYKKQIKDINHLLLEIQDILESNNIQYKIVGVSNDKCWYILYNTLDINSVIKKILLNRYKIYKQQISIYSALIEELNNGNIDKSQLLINLNQIKQLKEISNLNIITYNNLKQLFNKFNSNDLIYLLDQARQNINIRHNYIVICLLIDKLNYDKIIKIITNKYKNTTDIVIDKKDNSIIFIIKRLNKGTSLSEETEKISSMIASPLLKEQLVKNIGIAFKGHRFINKKYLPFLSFMTMVHASMLGAYKLAIYNDITFNVIGDEFLSFGDITGAIKQFKLGLKINPNNANLYNSLGVCLAELGKIQEAHNMFLNAVKFKPDDFMIQYNLAGSYIVKKDFKNALSALKTAHQLNPKDINIAIKLSSLLLKNFNSNEVIHVLKPFIDNNSNCNSVAIYKLLSRAYIDQRNWKEAKKLLKTALKIKPSDPEILAILALGYLECANDPGTAVRFAEQAETQVHNSNDSLKELLYKIKLRLENYDTYNVLKSINK